MKKLFALVAVAAFAVAFTACGGKKAEEAAAVEETTEVVVDTTAVADSVAADSVMIAE